ncbi:MAG: MarR family transcriptional regulator [Candidatus Omnitrophica bacterium]|nr:MarR family transcriptional regulator [Candidatus Omnitrophota bacterium]MCM8790771.1 MarR family transcriptional regulator [Candidatus Omnitrophota bacterium]
MTYLDISEFADAVMEIMPALMKEYMRRHVGNFYKMKITMPQFFVLEFLSRRDESKMSDIAEFMDVSTAAVTGIVDRLVRDGYIVRTSDPRDRRVVMVKLTAKGISTVKDIMEARKQATIKIFSGISQREREEYLKILTHIKEHVEGQEESAK